MDLGEIYVIQRENPYHEWKVREFVRKSEVRIRRVNWVERDIRRYRYSGLMAEKEVVWLQVGKMTSAMKSTVEEMKLRKRLIIIEIGSYEERKWVQSLKVDGSVPKIMPTVRTWKEKENECLRMLGEFRVEFESAEVRKRLIGVMIRDTQSWNDVRLGADIVRRRGEKITLPYLQDMFPTMEFYTVDDWIRGVLTGKLKQKSIKIAHYFNKEREYSTVWLMGRIRERAKDLALVYDAYRRGIIYGPVSKSGIIERSRVMGWKSGGKLAEMKPADMRWCLRVIEDLPYKYFVEVQKVLFSGDRIISEDWEMYRYIEELRQKRGEYENGKSAK